MRDSRIPPNCATLINTVTVCCCFVFPRFSWCKNPNFNELSCTKHWQNRRYSHSAR